MNWGWDRAALKVVECTKALGHKVARIGEKLEGQWGNMESEAGQNNTTNWLDPVDHAESLHFKCRKSLKDANMKDVTLFMFWKGHYSSL